MGILNEGGKFYLGGFRKESSMFPKSGRSKRQFETFTYQRVRIGPREGLMISAFVPLLSTIADLQWDRPFFPFNSLFWRLYRLVSFFLISLFLCCFCPYISPMTHAHQYDQAKRYIRQFWVPNFKGLNKLNRKKTKRDDGPDKHLGPR